MPSCVNELGICFLCVGLVAICIGFRGLLKKIVAICVQNCSERYDAGFTCMKNSSYNEVYGKWFHRLSHIKETQYW